MIMVRGDFGPTVAVLVAIALTALTVPGHARAADLDIRVHGGTLGLGLGLGIGITERFSARIGFNRYSISADFEEDDIDYEADLELETGYLLADWRPFAGRFRFTGGLMHNRNRFDGRAEVEAGTEVGDGVALFDGEMELAVRFSRRNVPYLGVGWDIGGHGRVPVAFTADVGILFQGSPSVDLDDNGTTGASEEDIEKEEQDIEDSLSDFDTYPVASIGLIFRF